MIHVWSPWLKTNIGSSDDSHILANTTFFKTLVVQNHKAISSTIHTILSKTHQTMSSQIMECCTPCVTSVMILTFPPNPCPDIWVVIHPILQSVWSTDFCVLNNIRGHIISPLCYEDNPRPVFHLLLEESWDYARPITGYWSNLPCDWPSTAWAYTSKRQKNGPWSMASPHRRPVIQICLSWEILLLIPDHPVTLVHGFPTQKASNTDMPLMGDPPPVPWSPCHPGPWLHLTEGQ